jgi:hypothetical protein
MLGDGAFRTNHLPEEEPWYLLCALEVEYDANEDQEYKSLIAWFWTLFLLWPCARFP